MDTRPRILNRLEHAGDGRIFQALSDSTRQRILQLLIAEELNVTELVAILKQPQSTVSRHLRVLRSTGLIVDRRDGVTTFYRAASSNNGNDGLTSILMSWLGSLPLTAALENRLARVLRERHDAASSFFERLGKRWDDLRVSAFGEAFAFEAFLSLMPRDWTVADIGSGTGYLLPALADSFARVIAVDPAPAMLECARQRVHDNNLGNVELRQGDLNRLPIDDKSCDLAIALLVLHHVPTPDTALAEIHRVVRPGGRLLIVEQLLHENQKFYETMQDHWWGFDPQDLVRQTAAAGFGSVRHRPLHAPQYESRSLDAPSLFVLTGERGQD